jgi:putative hydrolase of the HAD superfamily
MNRRLPPEPPRAVLIDLDDTLFDHAHSSGVALRAVYDAYPALAGVPFATFQADHAELLEALHLEVLRGLRTIDAAREERFRLLLAHYTVNGSAAEAAALYRATYLTDYRPVPGAAALLTWLRGRVAVAVVTNNAQAEQEAKLERLGMTKLIDALVVSETVGAAKPDPAIFAVALHQLGAAATQAVMLGDSWAADVRGAHAVGMRAIWLNRRRRPRPDTTPAAELTSLEPLASVTALLYSE